jgi:hypothetical protein
LKNIDINSIDYPWDAATFYSYDIHGNVDTLLQDFKTGMGAVLCDNNDPSGNRWKRIIYDYDLISGKVNDVAYQPGKSDQFFHHYNYDAENRITEVQTSSDKIYWESDATYEYYKHGPLARTVLGNDQVQGIDYAYTLQGWLKGVNSSSVGDGLFDMGNDGVPNTSNSLVALDAYGFNLNYFSGDYSPIINSSVCPNPFSIVSAPFISNSNVGANLFNGNIGSMLVNIPKLSITNSPLDANLYGYRYDQLNRLVSMESFKGLTTTNSFFQTETALNSL